MKFEVTQTGGEWIVSNDGVELARFDKQAQALDHVAAHLRKAPPAREPVSLRMRYQARD